MSVVWRPPRKLLPVLALFLCLVSTMVLVAQQEEIPAATAIQSEMTEITEEVVGDDSVAPDEVPPSTQETAVADEQSGESLSSSDAAASEPPVQAIPEISESQADAVPSAAQIEPAATADAPVVPDAGAAAVAADAVNKPVSETSVDESEKPADTAVAVAVAEPTKEPVVDAGQQYFDMKRANVLVVILTLMAFVSYYTFHAQRGKELFIRRISGLSALEDAVGRATEMGRGVLYIPGIMDMDDIQTIAGVTIMGHVAKKTAEYDTPLFAPMTRSFVMSVAQEIVKQSYLEKGRPDAYRPDRINYLTDDQFGYVAGVGGIMMREKPAACFYLGTFYAESLILAETGNAVGAIQIAGTAEPSQIPFFVAACDYTLIGEELFAASAYLSKNPKEVGSLKGQDIIKLLIIAVMIIGTLLVTIAKTEYGAGTVFASLAENFMRLLK
ncbi:MAG: hypothetical protein CVV42_18875 [Candidatus Riflebacteria bacterium HGW-Riflebacteria-2]|nr:MAG: hypothetical protein CVV42_18875 [Candidatus Riflebacteria bacterium HGW-Riflebacteria-2]